MLTSPLPSRRAVVSSVHATGPVADSGQTYQVNLTIGAKGCHGTLSLGTLCNPSQFANSFESQISGMVKGKTTTPARQVHAHERYDLAGLSGTFGTVHPALSSLP